jgi:tRNA nucleotidyltransferase (CCA-adding enzyme)
MEKVGRQLLRQLASHGYEAYWVGGCVRDKLLGRQLKDIDIATSAKPEDVMRFFRHSIPTGLQHGTVTVVEDGIPFEVTTFRRESEYEEHRRPKTVEYISDLNEDLQRRDFTINAVAMDADGVIIDPFQGQADMQQRILRCVGEARTRFEEDALRMLRCLRFACEYEMDIETGTWQALLECASLLEHIAMERVHAELDKIIAGHGPDRGIELLAASGLLKFTKEKLSWPIAASEGCPQQLLTKEWEGPLRELDEPDLRWAYWLLRMGVSSEAAKEGFARLRFAANQSVAITRLLQVQEWMGEQPSVVEAAAAESAALEHRAALEPLREALARASVRYGADAVRGWLRLLAPGAAPQAPPQAAPAASAHRAPSTAARNRLLQSGADWVQALPATRVSELALTGRDVLAALNRPAGPWLGRLLDGLLLEVALGRLPNTTERLLEAARQQIEREAT